MLQCTYIPLDHTIPRFRISRRFNEGFSIYTNVMRYSLQNYRTIENPFHLSLVFVTSSLMDHFGKLRAFFWPVYSYELKKLIPMFLLFFFILFNYTVLRDTKDTLIVTAPNSGAEAIPFLKVYGVLPGAILFMFIYAKLSNTLSKPALFYTTVTPFILFFVLFALCIYPYREHLHPHAFCDRLQTLLPDGFMGLIALIRNWTFSLFYILSELWGSVCLTLLFWGFANDITKVSESKRFYNLFGLGANLSLSQKTSSTS